MITKAALKAGWAVHYAPKNPIAVTFVLNSQYESYHSARSKLKTFQKLIDERRFGRLFYKRKPERRLDFLVAPEKFVDGHPHYHGILAVPDDHLALYEAGELIDLYQQTWRSVVPAGQSEFKPLFDPVCWLNYSSKENCISTSDRTIWSMDFVPTRA